ncbi:peptide chain release factor N(5)-glutamine methyltransferase [Pleionea litopenaei]|uniref:Release factor glutamine methyltransferase n=1 Tax=Pleionea litopenaei TaxID=3070815 RepID=A0AA51RSX4_9GAMM|nr:peptide chain release factor N(5)-glutamine methyltransferase [Pleionea sp. HL-JVS1]WMS87078.1 peptide chain release factor N(5)-glutamine methyltransferase [Pleionea sp. HL-JVS1]
MNAEELIKSAVSTFPDPDTAKLDAEILVCHSLKKPRSWLRAFARDELTREQVADIQQVFKRRIQGEPVAYILGEWEFFSLPLKVTPATLIPRPETESLVEKAIALLVDRPVVNIIDLGTGTGAIALALASNLPQASVSATDFSKEALSVAQLNAQSLGLPVTFYQGSWFQAVPSNATFDLIISNPPYVANDDPHMTQGDLPFEPVTALTAGDDEFADLDEIIRDAANFLNRQGWLMVEHGYYQGARVVELFKAAGFTKVQTEKDLSGNDRFTLGQFN